MNFWGFFQGHTPPAEDNDPQGYEDFDGDLYLRQNPDVAKSGLNAMSHYIKYGKAEGRVYPKKRSRALDDPDYMRIARSGYFDPEWYLAKYPDISGSELSPLEHFLQAGVWEGRDPGPFFSTTWYWAQYPDIVGANPLLHYIDFGHAEGRIPAPPKNGIETATSVYASLCDLDPGLCAEKRFSWFKGVPFVDGRCRNNPLKEALKLLIDDTPLRVTHFIFVPWLVHGGADLVAVNMCRAAEASIGLDRIAIVIVDYDQTDAIDWLPEGVTVINFARRTSGLSVEQRTDVLAKFIQTARPRKVLNINSAITWDLYRDRGVFLSQHTRPYVYLFCRDFNDLGHPAGYADTHFRDAFNNLISVYFDNASFREELIDQFTFLPDDAKILQVVRQQIKPGLINRRNERPKNRGGIRVLWASRLTRQKNYKLLAKIINASPRHISFSVWGDGAASDMQEFRSLLAPGCNVEINGKFASFESLPLEQYDAYLYTSLWDGIPNAILEAAAYGFPVVASNVGGVREVVDPQNGWLIHDLRNPAAYVTALQEIANDIKGAWIKGDKLRSFVIATHSPEAALKILGATGEFLEADLAV